MLLTYSFYSFTLTLFTHLLLLLSFIYTYSFYTLTPFTLIYSLYTHELSFTRFTHLLIYSLYTYFFYSHLFLTKSRMRGKRREYNVKWLGYSNDALERNVFLYSVLVHIVFICWEDPRSESYFIGTCRR